MNKPKSKSPFWTRRKILTLVWLAIFAAGLPGIKAALQNRINRQLTGALSDATGGRIERAELSFSVLQLLDFIQAAGALAKALQHPGRPVFEELILESPEIDLIPLGPLRWELHIQLHGLSAKAGTREVLMTQTEFRDALFRLDPEGPFPLVLEPLQERLAALESRHWTAEPTFMSGADAEIAILQQAAA